MSTFNEIETTTPYGDTDKVLELNVDSDSDAYILQDVIKFANSYTFSIWYRSEIDSQISFNILGESEIVESTAVWNKYVKTVSVETLDETNIYIIPSVGINSYFYEGHLVEGITDTSWNPAPEDIDSSISLVKTIAEQTAEKFTWLVKGNSSSTELILTENAVNAITNQFIVKSPDGKSVVIENGGIKADSITSGMLSTNSIMSRNYTANTDTSSPYSILGTYVDLSNGNIYTPNFGINGSNVYVKGEINALSGNIGGCTISNGVLQIKNANIVEKLTADQIASHCITANEITTENLIGKNGWINFADGTFNYGDQISWDGNELFISTNAITVITDDLYATHSDALDAAKTATNFLGFDASGLVVGDKTAETLGRNILIDDDFVAIRNGDTVLAEYGDSYIYLGKDNAKSIIDLCNGCATLYNEDSLDGTGKYKRLMIKAGDSINLDAPNGIYQSCFRRQDFNNSADARFDMSTSDIWVDGSIITKYSHIGLSLFNEIDGQVSTQDIDMNSKGVYISSSNSSTDKAAEIKLFSGDNTDIFSAYIGLKVNGYIFLNDNTSVDSDGNLYTNRLCIENEANGGLIRAKNTSGVELGLAGMSSADNMWFGYGNYYAGSGQTNLYGNDIQVYVKQAATSYRPYYRKGMNTGTIKWYGAGYISNSSKTLYFTIPLSVPIIGRPTVTVTSVDGFQVRQGNKYLYGSDSDTLVKPSSYTATIMGGGLGVLITATMANTTNVVSNNDSCGIHASIKITFS